MRAVKTWVGNHQGLATVLFTVVLFGFLIVTSFFVNDNSGDSSDIDSFDEEFIDEEFDEGEFVDSFGVFSNGWADATNLQPNFEQVDDYTIYYSPDVFSYSGEVFDKVASSWLTVYEDTFDNNNNFGFKVSYDLVSIFGSAYDSYEISNESDIVILADLNFEPFSETVCNFDGMLTASAGNPRETLYGVNTSVGLAEGEAEFLQDWDRDENYVSSIATTGLFVSEKPGQENILTYVGYNAEWEEMIFVVSVVENNIVKHGLKFILPADVENGVVENDNLFSLVKQATVAALQVVETKTTTVESPSLLFGLKFDKPFELKLLRDNYYSFNSFLDGRFNLNVFNTVVNQAGNVESEGKILAYNFDDNTVYEMVQNNETVFVGRTLNGGSTNLECVIEYLYDMDEVDAFNVE